MFKWLKARRERREQFSHAFTERMEFAEFAPTVTADDVLRIIRRDFPDANFDEILAALSAYGAEQYQIEKNRVHAAILRLSNGDPERVDQFVQLAIQEFRAVLTPAEMPGFSQLVPGLPPQEFVERPIEEIKTITQRDREQYIDWLNRENGP